MTDTTIADMRPEFLSPLARGILEARPDAYQKLVVRGASPAVATELLANVKPAQLLTVPVENPADATAMLGGLWLWHDALRECHELVQDLIGPTGAFWHAIMHRREGDFSNAKYWYARCADHRAFRLISASAMDIIGRHPHDKSILHIAAGEYNPAALVDVVEEIHNEPGDPRHPDVVRLQQLEWDALFYYCAYEATGAQGGMI